MIRYFMLDTNTVSDLMKGSPSTRTRLQQLKQDEIACISTITEAELRFGIARRPNSERLLFLYEELLQFIQVVPWESQQAIAYGKLRAKQEAMGKPLGPLDTLIAAHAVSLGAVLVSRDKAFQHVPDLPAIADWATDL